MVMSWDRISPITETQLMHIWKLTRPWRILALLGVAFVLAAPTWAAEIVVKNDSFVDGGAAVIVGDFVPGEQAAARLTSPCDGTIVAVQVAWLEGTPGHLQDIERSIFIYDGTTFPEPDTFNPLATLVAPLMTPGYINEFRYLDEAQTLPLNVPIAEGQLFYVSLEFENPTDVDNGSPSVIRDINGCQTGKNALYAVPGGWFNFCLFTTGDFVIRAVVECGELTGACCLPDGTCQDDLTAAECAALDGTYQGDLVTCETVNCPEPVGACCIEATGGCLDLTLANCDVVGGIWGGAGTDCATYVCFPVGACCLVDATCVDDTTPADCTALGGTFMGDGTACATVECPEAIGACCIAATGGCLELTQSQCDTAGGYWAGPGSACTDLNGDDIYDSCLAGDANCDGLVNAFDIDPFALALSSASGYAAAFPDCYRANADTNRDGLVNSFDIDPFVMMLVGG